MSESLKSMESSFEKNPTEREIFQQFEVILGNREFVEVEKTIDEEASVYGKLRLLMNMVTSSRYRICEGGFFLMVW